MLHAEQSHLCRDSISVFALQLYMTIHTVHDTENLTFPRNSVVVPRGTMRIFRTGAVELPLSCGRVQIFRADGHESSVRIRVENGGNQTVNFVHNNAKGSRNTPQGSFEISL